MTDNVVTFKGKPSNENSPTAVIIRICGDCGSRQFNLCDDGDIICESCNMSPQIGGQEMVWRFKDDVVE